MSLTKEDFYCGAFLSYLLNNGIKPALFEDREDLNRKIYDFTTDKGDFRVYVKFSEKPSSSSNKKNHWIWNFPFTESQIDEIKALVDKDRHLYFAFVCGQLSLKQSKIAVVPENIVLQSIDVNRENKYKSQSVKIKLTKGSWDYNIWGTARADKDSTGRDTTFKVRVKNIDDLFGKVIAQFVE